MKASFFEFAPEEHETLVQRGLVLAAFGHPVDDNQLKNDAFERNGIPSLKVKLSKQKYALKAMFSAKKILQSMINKYENLDLLKDNDFQNSKQMFEMISKHLYIMGEVFVI